MAFFQTYLWGNLCFGAFLHILNDTSSHWWTSLIRNLQPCKSYRLRLVVIACFFVLNANKITCNGQCNGTRFSSYFPPTGCQKSRNTSLNVIYLKLGWTKLVFIYMMLWAKIFDTNVPNFRQKFEMVIELKQFYQTYSKIALHRCWCYGNLHKSHHGLIINKSTIKPVIKQADSLNKVHYIAEHVHVD